MLLFAFELQIGSEAAGWGLMSNAAHPGYARTDLITNGPGASGLFWQINKSLRPFVSHSAAQGALPTLFAATSLRRKRPAIMAPTGSMSWNGRRCRRRACRRRQDQR